MSESNNAITVKDDDEMNDELANPEYEEPVVSGPSEGEVKDINAVDDDHPLVAETGDAALKTQTESGAGEFLSDFIYEHDSAWVREWLQNEETACVRAAKLLIRASDEYPDGWLTLTMWVDAETGETVIGHDDPQSILADYDGDPKELREIEVPRPIDEVLTAARSLGYDPTIVWDVYRDEQKIITEDNGIGMTPYEFDKAFNTIFNSGSGVDGETGGMFGVGSESSALVHGNDGGAEVATRSRRPTEDGEGYDGFRAYSYLGGANALPGEVEEGFMGTRFNIPVQESFDLYNLQGWIEDYADKLRVPLLYREHNAGSTPVEEEYEATKFTEDYGNPPITIERPGEFSVVAGPDVIDTGYNADDEDTFLVSMSIDRNTKASVNTFWNVVIQIHNEQGLIVSGPNRGRYRKDVDDLHEDDIVLPEPTGDRDRLQKDSKSKRFFNYIQMVVTERELEEVGDTAKEMQEASHPAEVIRDDSSSWKMFKKMVSYHGSHRVTDTGGAFRSFVNDRDEFPDYDKSTIRQIYGLFKKVEHAPFSGYGIQTKKSSRKKRTLGKILSSTDSSKVYMAASTGGNFKDRYKVAQNTHPNGTVIVISSASKYEKYKRNFGFNVLKNVPVRHAPDNETHGYDVPDAVHQDNQRKTSSRTKADKVADRDLKLRTSSDNSSIDLRLSIGDAKERLENGGRFGNKNKLVLFPRRSEHNISDNYHLAKYAAIASVSSTEYDELAHYDEVLTYEEFTEWSENTLIATEDGAMTPEELIEDDRLVVLTYRPNSDHDVVQLLGDEFSQLREYYSNDIRDQFKWARHLNGYDGGYRSDDIGNVPDSDKKDTLFAVAGTIVLGRAAYAFDRLSYDKLDIMGLRLGREDFGHKSPCQWNKLNKSTIRYRLMADTPKWDDSSDIYDIMMSNHKRDGRVGQMYLAFHEQGIDPSEKEPEELRELVN